MSSTWQHVLRKDLKVDQVTDALAELLEMVRDDKNCLIALSTLNGPILFAKLLKLLQDGSVNYVTGLQVNVSAAQVLASISDTAPVQRESIVKAGVLKVGKRYLEDQNCPVEVKEHLVYLLANIVTGCKRFRNRCVKLTLHLIVLQFLSHPSFKLQQHSVRFLHNVFAYASQLPITSLVPCFEPMVTCARTSTEITLKQDCYTTLCRWCTDEKMQIRNEGIEALLLVDGVPEMIIQEIEACLADATGTLTDLLRAVLSLAEHIALNSNAAHTQRMVDVGIVHVIHKLFRSEQYTTEVSNIYLYLLGQIVGHPTTRVAVMCDEPGLIPFLVESFKKKHTLWVIELLSMFVDVMELKPLAFGTEFVKHGALGAILHATRKQVLDDNHTCFAEDTVEVQVMALLSIFTEEFETLEEEGENMDPIRYTFIKDLVSARPGYSVLEIEPFHNVPEKHLLDAELRTFSFSQHLSFVMDRIGVMKRDSEPLNIFSTGELTVSDLDGWLHSFNSTHQFILGLLVCYYDDAKHVFDNISARELYTATMHRPGVLVFILSLLVAKEHPIISSIEELAIETLNNATKSNTTMTIDEFSFALVADFDTTIMEDIDSFWTIVGVLDSETLNSLMRLKCERLNLECECDEFEERTVRHTYSKSEFDGDRSITRLITLGTFAYLTANITAADTEIHSFWQIRYASELIAEFYEEQYASQHGQSVVHYRPLLSILEPHLPKYLRRVIEVPLRKSSDRLITSYTLWQFEAVHKESLDFKHSNFSQVLHQHLNETFCRESVIEFMLQATIAGFVSKSTRSVIYLPSDLVHVIATKWCTFEYFSTWDLDSELSLVVPEGTDEDEGDT